jgi:hypothetical protein
VYEVPDVHKSMLSAPVSIQVLGEQMKKLLEAAANGDKA